MAVYQWFGVVYIIGCFFVIPILSIVIVLTNELVYWIIFYFIMSILIIVWIITGLQVKFREDYLNASNLPEGGWGQNKRTCTNIF